LKRVRGLFPAGALLLACAACNGPAASTKVAAGDKSSDESGQARAEDAGKALIGKPAPALKLATIGGQVIDLAKIYGRQPVYLKFWATWCVPCLQQMPHFERTYETLGRDIAVVAVNTNFNETPQGVAAYGTRHGLKMPIVMDDGRLAAALNLRVTPQHVIVGRDGRIAYIGHLADGKLDAALQAARTAPTPVTAIAHPSPILRAERPPTATTLAGEVFPLRDPAGARTTALMFLSPWCEGYLKTSQPVSSAQCRTAREQSEALARASGGVRWIGIASGLWADHKDLRDYQAEKHVSIPLALDSSGDIFRAYHVRVVPTVVLIGRDGREIGRASGDVTQVARLAGAQS
jgi:peroxiredoxin